MPPDRDKVAQPSRDPSRRNSPTERLTRIAHSTESEIDRMKRRLDALDAKLRAAEPVHGRRSATTRRRAG